MPPKGKHQVIDQELHFLLMLAMAAACVTSGAPGLLALLQFAWPHAAALCGAERPLQPPPHRLLGWWSGARQAHAPAPSRLLIPPTIACTHTHIHKHTHRHPTAAEVMFPHSFPLAAARPMLLLLIGAWFIEIGRILFGGAQARRESGSRGPPLDGGGDRCAYGRRQATARQHGRGTNHGRAVCSSVKPHGSDTRPCA